MAATLKPVAGSRGLTPTGPLVSGVLAPGVALGSSHAAKPAIGGYRAAGSGLTLQQTVRDAGVGLVLPQTYPGLALPQTSLLGASSGLALPQTSVLGAGLGTTPRTVLGAGLGLGLQQTSPEGLTLQTSPVLGAGLGKTLLQTSADMRPAGLAGLTPPKDLMSLLGASAGGSLSSHLGARGAAGGSLPSPRTVGAYVAQVEAFQENEVCDQLGRTRYPEQATCAGGDSEPATP
jgi:hypothetical protein